MKNYFKFFTTVFIATIINTVVIFLFNNNINIAIKSITMLNYDSEKETITIEIKKKESLIYDYKFSCNAEVGDTIIKDNGNNNTCILTLPINKDYQIYLENKFSKSTKLTLIEHLDNMLDFKFNNDIIYLPVEGKKKISYTDKYILPSETFYEFYSNNEDVAIVQNGYIIGKGKGETIVRVKGSDEYIKVIVTDLISDYTLAKTKKEIIPCNKYTEEEAEMLDTLLEYYVNEAGYETRAGAVAAGRFLTLQFKYRVPYFYENGRINDSGVHKADGEGRYYKKGLYLSESKYADILYTYANKALWGCPLKNGTNNTKYGYVAGKMMPNGLDCSGFVSWALVNGGFDPGDVGAGENEGIYQLTDTGDFAPLTRDLAMSGKIKTGDLFNFWGHIALIIGQDANNYYVAESLPHLGGVIAKTYPKTTVANTFEFVVFMDRFYKNDGNLVDHWEE